MIITDELRKWAEGNTLRVGMSLRTARDQAIAIADRIDAEHVDDVAKAYDEGRNGMKALLERDYVKLPTDADGVSIHIGDVLTDDAEFKSEGNVKCLMLDEDGWMVGFGKGWTYTRNHEWHHYHKPTIEEVLREFAFQNGQSVTDDGIVAEFAEKLLEVVEHGRD